MQRFLAYHKNERKKKTHKGPLEGNHNKPLVQHVHVRWKADLWKGALCAGREGIYIHLSECWDLSSYWIHFLLMLGGGIHHKYRRDFFFFKWKWPAPNKSQSTNVAFKESLLPRAVFCFSLWQYCCCDFRTSIPLKDCFVFFIMYYSFLLYCIYNRSMHCVYLRVLSIFVCALDWNMKKMLLLVQTCCS